MRTPARFVPPALLLAALAAPPAHAQDGPGQAHIGHVAEAFGATPDGQGLLPTAQAEARIAATHAELAARDLENLDAMKRHAGHVLNAVDPERMPDGPGLGFGVLAASGGVVTHIELAAAADGASDNIKVHSTHVATSARNTVARAEEMVLLCERISAAGSAAEAAPLMNELVVLAQALSAGVDANGDGNVGWQEGEGGLDQAAFHLDLMMKGEGMADR